MEWVGVGAPCLDLLNKHTRGVQRRERRWRVGIQGGGFGFHLGLLEASGKARLSGKGDPGIFIPPDPFPLPSLLLFLLPLPIILSLFLQQGWVQSCTSHWSFSERRGESFGPWACILLPGGWVLGSTPTPPNVGPVP